MSDNRWTFLDYVRTHDEIAFGYIILVIAIAICMIITVLALATGDQTARNCSTQRFDQQTEFCKTYNINKTTTQKSQ